MIRTLGDTSVLAVGEDNRHVVIKRLDTDCLLENKLHPSIAERLNRIRELAHGSVANLYAVARDNREAHLIWQYLPGQTWDEFLAGQPDVRQRLTAARELVLNIELLHMQGIVHGALVGSNIILGDDHTWRITHVSPLLYTDMTVDVESVSRLLRDAAGDDVPDLAKLVEGESQNLTLRQLSSKVAALLESNGQLPPEVEQSPRRELRLRTLGLVIAVTLVALVFAYEMWRQFSTP